MSAAEMRKKKYYDLCTKNKLCRKYKGKTNSLNLKFG